MSLSYQTTLRPRRHPVSQPLDLLVYAFSGLVDGEARRFLARRVGDEGVQEVCAFHRRNTGEIGVLHEPMLYWSDTTSARSKGSIRRLKTFGIRRHVNGSCQPEILRRRAVRKTLPSSCQNAWQPAIRRRRSSRSRSAHSSAVARSDREAGCNRPAGLERLPPAAGAQPLSRRSFTVASPAAATELGTSPIRRTFR